MASSIEKSKNAARKGSILAANETSDSPSERPRAGPPASSLVAKPGIAPPSRVAATIASGLVDTGVVDVDRRADATVVTVLEYNVTQIFYTNNFTGTWYITASAQDLDSDWPLVTNNPGNQNIVSPDRTVRTLVDPSVLAQRRMVRSGLALAMVAPFETSVASIVVVLALISVIIFVAIH